MNRTIFSLLVLLLFGLFSQPITAQSSKNQQNAKNKVARMSEEKCVLNFKLRKQGKGIFKTY